MKKIIGLVILSIILIGCRSEPNIENSFKSAVNEVYKKTAETLFYSSDGVNSTHPNRVKGTSEIPGVCTDYAIEFAYYWNEVFNYDSVYGKAYLARIPSSGSNFKIQDVTFMPNGTSKIRETSGSFGINGNDQESDGVYRDVKVTKEMYVSEKLPLHFGDTSTNHKWVVIYFNNNWWDCDPTWYDSNSSNKNFVPYILDLN